MKAKQNRNRLLHMGFSTARIQLSHFFTVFRSDGISNPSSQPRLHREEEEEEEEEEDTGWSTHECFAISFLYLNLPSSLTSSVLQALSLTESILFSNISNLHIFSEVAAL